MKKLEVEKVTLNQVLVVIAGFLAFMIILSTIIGLCQKKSRDAKAYNSSIVVAQGQDEEQTEYYSFKNMERIRIVPAGEEGQSVNATIIVTPYFSYQKDDTAFYEELSRKNQIIKSTIVNYFSSKKITELKSLGENQVKKQLLSEINENLVLNKIQEIYFSEYVFLQ